MRGLCMQLALFLTATTTTREMPSNASSTQHMFKLFLQNVRKIRKHNPTDTNEQAFVVTTVNAGVLRETSGSIAPNPREKNMPMQE
jgi:hypothetical protein